MPKIAINHMISFIVTVVLLGLWLHYATRWFGIDEPTFLGALVTATLSSLAWTAMTAGYLLLGATYPIGEFATLKNSEFLFVLYLTVFPLIGFASFLVGIRIFLVGRRTHLRPTWSRSAGLSAVTIAIVTLMSSAWIYTVEAN